MFLWLIKAATEPTIRSDKYVTIFVHILLNANSTLLRVPFCDLNRVQGAGAVSCIQIEQNKCCEYIYIQLRVPVRVSHVAIGESSKELAKPNLWILAILAKSMNSSN